MDKKEREAYWRDFGIWSEGFREGINHAIDMMKKRIEEG